MAAPTTFPDRAEGSAPAAQRVPVINGLRGVAILGVVYAHVVTGVWPADAVPIAISPLLTNGSTGVNLFFVLSGFVLSLPFAAGDRPLGTTRDWLSFYRRRALRLMPLFYVAVTAEWVVTAWLGGGANVHELLSVLSLGFIVDARSFGPSFNPPLWSIGVEIAFSALLPPLVEVARHRGLLRLLALVIVVSLFARVAGIIRYPAVHSASFGTDMFLCRLDEFVLGMVAAQLYVRHRLPRRPGRWALAGMALVTIAWVGFDLQLRGILPPLTRAILGNVLDAGFGALVLAALVPGTRLAAALSWRPLQVLGMMCYSVYIWHWPLLGWVMPDRAALPAAEFAAALVSYLLLTAALAALSYRFIEFARVRAWRPLFLLPAAPRAAPSPVHQPVAGTPTGEARSAAASHISRGSKVSAANMVRITTPQKARAPTPGSIVITEPKATRAPSSDSIKMSIIDQRPMKRTMW